MEKLHKIISLPANREIEIGDVVKSNITYNYEIVTDKWLINRVINDWKPQIILLLSDISESFKYGDLLINSDISSDHDEYLLIYTYDGEYYGGTRKILAANNKFNLPQFEIGFLKEWVKDPVFEVNVLYTSDKILSWGGGIEKGKMYVKNNYISCNIPLNNDNDQEIITFAQNESNSEKHDNIKLDYKDGIFYGINIGIKSDVAKKYWFEQFKKEKHE